MKKLQVRLSRNIDDSQIVGTLADDQGQIYFEYHPGYINTGLNLSPFHLPFETDLFQHKDREFGPLPGLFDDSLPDGWGLLLMDRHFRSVGKNLSQISALDRLSWLGERTMGALTYHPAGDDGKSGFSSVDLHDLASQSEDILSGSAAEVLPQLLRAGGAPGGARPKVLVGFNPHTGTLVSGDGKLADGLEPWIVKFAGQTDTGSAGAIEYAYSLMARAAGIEMPPTHLFKTAEGDRFFGVKRFDRHFNRRFHVHTFGNMIQSNFRIPSADYADLLKATSLLTRNHQEVLKVFRQMVFNVLAHNRDDHVKNFAYILDDECGEWGVSPAYDLLFSHGPGGEHTMTLAGQGERPGRTEFLQLRTAAGINQKEAEFIIDEVQEAVRGWREIAINSGVLPEIVEEIAKVLQA